MQSEGYSIFIVLLFIFISFLLYFLPGLIAYHRKHNSRAAILVLNLLLGWTFLGWVISLVWSFTGNTESMKSTILTGISNFNFEPPISGNEAPSPPERKTIDTHNKEIPFLESEQAPVADPVLTPLELDPDEENAAAWFNRGKAYLKNQEYDQAIDALTKAIELDPTNSLPYYNRANIYKKLGRKDQAIEDLRDAAKLGHKTAQGMLRSRWKKA